MSSIQHSTIETNGIRMHVAQAGSGFPVLLCHGFPETWYSWRHQMQALAAAGFRAIAPDQRGYGESDAPAAIDQYSMHHLVGDLTGLLDALEIEKAVIVGHDWGGLVVWQMSLLAAHRVAGVVGVNTPFIPRMPISPLAMMRAMAQGNFHYILYFQEPGVADAELARDVRTSLQRIYQKVPRALVEATKGTPSGVAPGSGGGFLDRMPELGSDTCMGKEDFEVFVRSFERSGFRGGLNWYRNFERNWETTAYLAGAKVQAPALMVTAELDPVLRPEMANGMSQWVPNLRDTILIKDCGHWTQQEKPDELNAALIGFLHGLQS